MNYKLDVIRRGEIECIENFLDRLLSSFKQDGEIYGGHDPITDRWEGKYTFKYLSGKLAVIGDFIRTSKDTYKGNVSIDLDPKLEALVLQNLSELAPSLADKIKASA